MVTHIVTAFGQEATINNKTVIFTIAQLMIQHLKGSESRGKLEAALKKFRKVPLSIIDEIGFMLIDEESGNCFFSVINE